MTIKDYPCTYDNSAGISQEITHGLGLTFPDAHCRAASLATLSKALKEHDGGQLCEMPLCHTVEAEAMGAIINLGNERSGPRVKDYACSSLQEVLDLPPIDFSKGRIHEVLEACRILSDEGECVALEVCGPVTVLSSLVDIRHIMKALRKDREAGRRALWKVGEETLRFVEEAKGYGVQIVSWADSAGGVNILGPRFSEQIVEDFTYDFIKRLAATTDRQMLLCLCPKTSFALIGTGKARFENRSLPAPMSFGEACKHMIGTARIAGQTCIKNTGFIIGNAKFKELLLE